MAEPAATRLSRLLSMVPWLEQHPGVRIRDAAEHFGVSAAELERDLWLTICCGLPGHGPDQLIDIQFWDDDGAIHVIDPQTLDRPLRLNPSEAMSLLVGLRLLAQIPGDHDRSALASVTAKLEAAADVTQGAALVVDQDDDDVSAVVADALATQRALRLVYAGASRDEVTERVVEPAQMLHHAGRSYLAAWCREAGATRTFRLDRIRAAEVLDEPISSRDDQVSIAPTSGQPIRLRVSPRSRWVLETWDVSDLREGDDGTREATVMVADLEWLTRIVLGQGGGVEILAPRSLRLQVRDRALQALKGPDPE